MIGIIQDWLFSQLGINFDFNNLLDNNIFKDGFILVDILKKYGLIHNCFSFLTPTDNNLQCTTNLCLLKPLFDMLKVNFNDSIILDIVEGKSSTIMKLLYELYVCLENKQHLYLIKQLCYEKVQCNIIECSNIQLLEEHAKCDINYNHSENLCLENPFLRNKDVISWYERKYNYVKNNLDARLSLLKREICQETIVNGHENKTKCPCNDFNDKTSINESLPNLYMYPASNNKETLLNHNDFIIKYKNKLKQKIDKKNVESALQNDILSMTWSKIMENQHKVYNKIFSDILLKQSHYEKQILNKLISTQKQLKVQDVNQTRANKLVLNEYEGQVNNDLKLKEDFLELELLYRNEQKRVLELHKKLYKEKQHLKKNNTIAMCNDIIQDLFDIVIVASEYKLNYGQDVSRSLWNNWMQLFFKGKPVHIPLENLKHQFSYVTEEAYDDIIRFERDQDEMLDDHDIEEYLLTSGRWFFEDICLEAGTNGDNVISFIIYRLLSSKYPPPESPKPANIPPFKSATILLDIQNSSSIDRLKMLLSKSKIHIFDTVTAIMKSVNTFQKETSPPTEDKPKGIKNKTGNKNKKSNTNGSEQIKTEKNTTKLQKNKKNKNKTDLKAQKIEKLFENDYRFIDKETQTSTVELEQEKEIRTELGLIGEEISKLLSEGKKLDDSLVVKVIIEYLKTLEDAEGWLLLNYPSTIYQASELELALTGKNLRIADYIITEDYELNAKENIDPSIFKRKSKLYLSPEICKDDNKFVSHFSQIISTKYSGSQPPYTHNKAITNNTEKYEENITNCGEEQLDKSDILEEDFLKVFYSKLALFQEFNYDITNLNNLKQLARVILKEDSINAKNSIELFGDEIINKLTNPKGKNKKTNVSPAKKKSKFEGNKKQSKAAIDMTVVKQRALSDDDSKIVPTEIVTPKDTELEKRLSTEPRIINPGESGWEYITLPIDNQMTVILASIWENIEMSYLSQLRDIFFENRIINLRLVPYSTYAREEIEKMINKPDIKQDVVNYFTKSYNAIDNDLKTLSDVKSQLHCKVYEMQQALWKISDNDKQEIEAKRKQIILENWVANELCLLINNHLCLIQCELDRSFETMKLIQNYYLSMLYECPPTTVKVQISRPIMEKINANTFLKSSNMSNKQDPVDLSTAEERNSQLSDNIIVSNLINCCEKDKIFELFNESLLNEIRKAKVDIKFILDSLCSQITVEDNTLSSNKRKEANGKSLRKENILPQRKFNEKPNKKDQTKQSNELNVNGNETDDKKKLLLLEWQFALSNEEKRFITCLELIRKKAEENIMEFYCYLENVFCQLCEAALSKYDSEILNINKLCEYIHTAIEEESPLLYPCILSKSTFCINKSGTYQKNQEQYELPELTEETHECYFTIKQLNKLMHVFRIAGPYGVIRKQPFCYILQDLMLFNSDDNQPHLPEIWHHLNESQLRDVMIYTFGTAYSIDWRDFIIYNLEIPYPSITDILLLKKTFLLYDLNESETICMDDYEKVILWFEVDLPSNPMEVLKLAMTKKLLFEMFQVNESFTNYTALLLYFCKDYEPHNGLRKALCLSCGKNIITSKDELNDTIRNDIETRENVKTLLNNIITGVVMNRDGVLIYEISDSNCQLNINDDDFSSYSVSMSSDSIHNSNNSGITPKRVRSIVKGIQQIHEINSREADVDSFEKSWASRIPVATVVSVLNTLFHNQDKTYDLRNLYLCCLEEESDAEGMIEGHVLINLSCIQKLFNTTNKFKISSPCNILQQKKIWVEFILQDN